MTARFRRIPDSGKRVKQAKAGCVVNAQTVFRFAGEYLAASIGQVADRKSGTPIDRASDLVNVNVLQKAL
jgi:hypothetical protein